MSESRDEQYGTRVEDPCFHKQCASGGGCVQLDRLTDSLQKMEAELHEKKQLELAMSKVQQESATYKSQLHIVTRESETVRRSSWPPLGQWTLFLLLFRMSRSRL